MNPIIEKRKNEIIQICKILKVKRLYSFGSVMNESFRADSDIDFLISFKDDLSIQEYTNNFFALHYKLRELLKRDIDIVTERSLSNPYFIASIDESKELIYEA